MTGATGRRGRAWLAGAAVLALALAGALVALGLAEVVATPIERQVTLPVADLPGGTAVRIALLSDIHLGNRAMTVARLDAIVAQVDAARPDLILLAGDFVNGHAPGEAALAARALAAPLARLRASLGVVAVLGNHDHWTGARAVTSALQQAGVTVLANQVARRGPLLVMGVDDVYSGHDDFAATAAAAGRLPAFPVVLTHSPDLVDRGRAGDMPLIMAGHTHCGQVVVPGWGSLANRSLRTGRRLFNPRYRCGVIRQGSRTMIVTAGVGGGSAPVRLGAPPDWWLVTLRATHPKGWTPLPVPPPTY